jgi:hypothetical protein
MGRAPEDGVTLPLWIIAAATSLMATETIVFAVVRLVGWIRARRHAKLVQAAVEAVERGDLTMEEAIAKYRPGGTG